MEKETRRRFFGSLLGAAAAATPLFANVSPREALTESPEADLVLLNGNVFTVDDSQPHAEAFAIKHSRFVAAGSSHDVKNLIGKRTQVIDATGMTVLPGLIDAHSHPAWGGIEELVSVDCDLRSVEEIKAAIHRRALATPPGNWVLGFKYDDVRVREKRRITREDLDEVAPNNPVRIQHRGGHLCWYNSIAFALAKVTPETPDPPGGRFVKRDGKLDGCVEENANRVFYAIIPSDSTEEQRRAGVALISKRMTAAGLTSVTDAECPPDYLSAYQDAYHAGELRFRVYILTQGYAPIRVALENAGVRGQFGDEWVRIGGVKYLADGSCLERTMRMSTPYQGRPNDYGILTITQEELYKAAEDANAHDYQMGVHANGDVAIDMVLKAYERVKANGAREPYRPRIEHCTLVNPDLLERIKKVGAIPTPFYTYVYYHGDKWDNYGDEKLRWMFAHASFIQYGIPVASGSDYIPGPYEPMMALQSMVTRKDYRGHVWGANQRITVDQALRVCTINAAHAAYDENVKGSITAGKFGDFVMLAEDPHTVDPDHLKDIPVVRTVVGGKTVHEA
ncbi:MAG: amidohydrolase [Candidatus Acidiferrales bacterium]